MCRRSVSRDRCQDAGVSVPLRRELLMTGRYVAAIPASTLRLKVREDALKALPVAFPNKPWPVVMVTIKDRILSSAAQHFLECARVAARQCRSARLANERPRVPNLRRFRVHLVLA